MSAPCYLGVDVGASKTHLLLADQEGHVLADVTGGGANPDNIGLDGMRQALRDLLAQTLSAAGIRAEQIAGAGYGIAGYDWPSQRAGMLAAIETLGLSAPCDLVNDAMLALLAGASENWGVGVVAGTSCNAWGRSPDHRYGHMTGFSFLGEAAGAFELVQQAQHAIGRAWTRRGAPTRITELLRKELGAASDDDLIEGLARQKYSVKAQHAVLIFQAAREGDQVAHDLVLWAGRELGDLAVGVIRQLDLSATPVEIILAGSFWKGSPLLRPAFESVALVTAPRARIHLLEGPPVTGAFCLAMESAGLPREQIHAARIRVQRHFADATPGS